MRNLGASLGEVPSARPQQSGPGCCDVFSLPVLSACLLKLMLVRTISLHAWKLFNMANQKLALDVKPDDQDSEQTQGGSPKPSPRFFHHIQLTTANDLTTYIAPLQPSGSLDFLSHIRIAGPCQIKTEELLQLTGLKNLGVLEIMEPADEASPFPRVSDRILRSWSEEKDVFPKLVILKIHALYGFSENSLRYLNKFPALTLFEVGGRPREWQQSERLCAEVGWVHCDELRARRWPRSSHRSTDTPDSACAQITQQVSDLSCSKDSDLGSWACCIYTSITTKPLSMFRDAGHASSARASCSCRSGVPFASLILGLDTQTIRCSSPAARAIYFWRRSFFAEDLSTRAGSDSDRLQEGHSAPVLRSESPGPTKPAKNNARRTAPTQHSNGGRPKKRRQMGSIGDVLNSLQN